MTFLVVVIFLIFVLGGSLVASSKEKQSFDENIIIYIMFGLLGLGFLMEGIKFLIENPEAIFPIVLFLFVMGGIFIKLTEPK